MRIIENIFSPEDIQVFKKYWVNNHQHAYVNGKPTGLHPGIGVHDHIDRRLLIKKNTQAYDILQKMNTFISSIIHLLIFSSKILIYNGQKTNV